MARQGGRGKPACWSPDQSIGGSHASAGGWRLSRDSSKRCGLTCSLIWEIISYRNAGPHWLQRGLTALHLVALQVQEEGEGFT